jgi:Tfp pilus assembly protein PilO
MTTPTLSLSNPNALRTLRIVRICLLILVALGSGLGGYCLWNLRRAVSAENERVESYRKQIAELREALSSKRKDAALAEQLRTEPPDGAGSVFFTQQVNHLAEQMNLERFNLRMNDMPKPQAAAPPAGGNAQGGNAGGSPSNAGAAGSEEIGEGPLANWSRSGFDVEVAGQFRDLSHFLKRLAAIPFVAEVTSIEVNPLNGSKKRDGKLKMRLSGTLYGLPAQATEAK